MADGEALDTKVGAQLAGESPESSLWFAWKRAHELVRAAVIEEVTATTGLSDPDIGILLRLDVAGRSLRQSEIASALEIWYGARTIRTSNALAAPTPRLRPRWPGSLFR